MGKIPVAIGPNAPESPRSEEHHQILKRFTARFKSNTAPIDEKSTRDNPCKVSVVLTERIKTEL
jgi:hypothetical protein